MTRFRYVLAILVAASWYALPFSELSSKSSPVEVALLDMLRLLDSIIFLFFGRLVSAQQKGNCDLLDHVGIGRFTHL